MAKIELTREYVAERARLFAYITDPRLWVDWYNNCIQVTEADGWASPGDEAGLVVRLLGRDIAVRMELAEYEADAHTRIRITASGIPDVTQIWDLSDAGEGTAITVTLTTEEATSFFGKVVDRFLLPKTMERDLSRSLDNLEDLVGIGL